MDRIAYVGVDGNIFTINPDGSDSHRLTGSTSAGTRGGIQARPLAQNSIFHAWPTWSPDGSKLAVSRVVLAEDGNLSVSLFRLGASEGDLTKIYENEQDASPVIAETVPHYMYWSPDGESLAFIASTSMALTLFVYTEGAQTTAASNEGPLYFKWAGDSNSMLIHARDKLATFTAPFDQPPVELAPMDLIYRAPDLSSDGSQAAYISSVEQGSSLLVGDPSGAGQFRELMPIEGIGALLWSPTDDVIAVIDGTVPGGPGYGRLRVISPDGSEPRTLVEEPVVAFFWSPDGKLIAYVAVDIQRQALVWKVVRADGGEPWELAAFVPTRETLTALSFFDQYAHSHSVWSPDSTRLVFGGLAARAPGAANGASPNEGSIYVINTEPGSLPREIANGTLAFWSWN